MTYASNVYVTTVNEMYKNYYKPSLIFFKKDNKLVYL